MVSRRTFTREFKIEICRLVSSGDVTKSAACREHGLNAGVLNRWLDQYVLKGEKAFEGEPWRAMGADPESRTKELEAALGRAHLEIELLKLALAKKPSRPGSDAK